VRLADLWAGGFSAGVVDADGLLDPFEPGMVRTLVVDVSAPDCQLVVREVYPPSLTVTRQLTRHGLRPFIPEEHAAVARGKLPDQPMCSGWLQALAPDQ
jgi:hypothetical protein